MAWIESHQSLGTHPKTKRLARILGINLPQAVGHVQYLWWWAADFAPNGCLNAYDAADVADACLWPGDPIVFVEALLCCGGVERRGFIEKTTEGWIIHDWNEYQGRIIAYRELNAKRMRERRASHVQRTDVAQDSHVQDTTDVRVTHAEDLPVPVPVPRISATATATSPPIVPQENVRGSEEPDEATKTIKLFLETRGGNVNMVELNSIADLITEYSHEWVSGSIRDAVQAGKEKPTLNYLSAILKRWKTDGYKTDKRKRGGNGVDRGNTEKGATGEPADPPDRFARTRAMLAERDAAAAAYAAKRGANPT